MSEQLYHNNNLCIYSKIAFFRGSRTSSDRDHLINNIAVKYPQIVDAKYTKGTSQRADALRKYPAAAQVPLRDHCRYRFLIDIRGVAASFRFRHLFLCKSLVFHVVAEPEWIEFFHIGLVAWVHYIPIKKDLSDLVSKIKWSIENSYMAQQIAQTGFEFVRDHMRVEDITNYYSKLLNGYADLQRWSPALGSRMKEVMPTHETQQYLKQQLLQQTTREL